MIAIRFRRIDGTAGRLAVPRDDDQALDFVLAAACREFGDPTKILPHPPKPKREARR